MSVLIRPAVAADVAQLVAIARRAWLSAFAGRAPAELVAHWRATDREPAWYARYWPDMLVAEVEGGPVGLAQPAQDEVNGLWVDPTWHRRGVGTRLLSAAEDHIRADGHSRAWLTCSAFNQPAAAFYRSRGYVLERQQAQLHPSGVPEALLIFARQLSAPAA